MDDVAKIPFSKLSSSSLVVDAVYEGGNKKDLSSEVLSKLLRVGNSEGFRKCMKVKYEKRQKKSPMFAFIHPVKKSNGEMNSIEQSEDLLIMAIIEKLETQ